MRCQDAKKILKFKCVGDKKVPDDETLSDVFFEAMLYVANKFCVA